MALHKFEKNIKDTLEKRTIKPSANAWNKLDEKLKFSENKKNNSVYWFIGIAASIIGVLLIVPLFLNTTIENTTPIIVDTKNIINEEINNSITEEETVIAEENLKTIETTNNPSKEKTKIKNQPILKAKKEQFAFIKTTDTYKQNIEKEDLNKVIEIHVNQVKLNQLTFQEQKVNELVAEIENLKSQKNTITDAGIETLLNKAQKEIALNKIYNENTKTVDANLLLQDVEADLDKSFRDKVFEALKINYENALTVVSQRND